MPEGGIAQQMLAVRNHASQLVAQMGAASTMAAPLLDALQVLEQQVLSMAESSPPDPLARPGRDIPAVFWSQMEQVLHEVPTGICILDGPDQRYTFTNPFYEQVAGRTQVIGKTVREVFPELAGQGMYETLAAVYETGIPFRSPKTLLRLDRDGDGVAEDVYFTLTFQPLRNGEGTITGIVAYVVDISDRHALEQERANVLHLMQVAHQTAEVERQRLLDVLCQAPAAICTVEGPEHRFTFTNPRYNQLVGGRDVVGKTIREALPEVAGQGFFELMDQVYATGEPFMGNEIAILLDRNGAGQVEPAFLNFLYTPLRDTSDAISGIFVHAVDVTELVESRQAAEAAVVLRDQFLSIAAHELKTPLTSLRGYIQVLQRRMRRAGPVDERTDHILTLLGGQGQRLTRLIDTLLDVARITLGHLSLEREPLDLGGLTLGVVEEVRVTADRRDIQVLLPAEPCIIMGDSLRLEQVLVNLVQNALKYSPGGGLVAVTVGADRDQAWVQVRDNGLGIPAADLPHLFERFYRVTAGRSGLMPGMGIGLAVVNDIVALHGGKITVESTEEVGSTFTVYLPRETPELAGLT